MCCCGLGSACVEHVRPTSQFVAYVTGLPGSSITLAPRLPRLPPLSPSHSWPISTPPPVNTLARTSPKGTYPRQLSCCFPCTAPSFCLHQQHAGRFVAALQLVLLTLLRFPPRIQQHAHSGVHIEPLLDLLLISTQRALWFLIHCYELHVSYWISCPASTTTS